MSYYAFGAGDEPQCEYAGQVAELQPDGTFECKCPPQHEPADVPGTGKVCQLMLEPVGPGDPEAPPFVTIKEVAVLSLSLVGGFGLAYLVRQYA